MKFYKNQSASCNPAISGRRFLRRKARNALGLVSLLSLVVSFDSGIRGCKESIDPIAQPYSIVQSESQRNGLVALGVGIFSGIGYLALRARNNYRR